MKMSLLFPVLKLVFFIATMSLAQFDDSIEFSSVTACLQKYSTCQDEVIRLIDHFAGPLDAVVDIGTLSGHHAIAYQMSRNRSAEGFIVIIDNDVTSFHAALEYAKHRDVYNRLVAFLIPRDNNDAYSAALDQLFLPPHVIQCPVIIRTSDRDPTFISHMHMVMRCRPIILAERLGYDFTAEFAIAMERIGYSLFYHVSLTADLTDIHLSATNTAHAISIYLVAIPAEKASTAWDLMPTRQLLELQRSKYYIDEYNISLVLLTKYVDSDPVVVDAHICSQNDVNLCTSESAPGLTRVSTMITHVGARPLVTCSEELRYRTTLHLNDITHSMDDASLQHCNLSTCSLEVDIPSSMSLPAAQFVFYALCQKWVTQLNSDLIGACLLMLSGRFEHWKSNFDFSSIIASADETEIAGKEFFDPAQVSPFASNFSSDVCSDPIWCSHTKEFQERLRCWQYPSQVSPDVYYSFPSCDKAKFLVYQPYSHLHGIGSMILQVATMFRLALCLGRILYLLPVDQAETSSRWLHPGCRNSVLECYFERITNCTLPYDEYISEVMDAENGNMMHLPPFRDKRILYTRHLPTKGPCSVCGAAWTHNTQFFDGLFTGESGYVVTARADGSIDDSSMRYFDQSKKHISHMDTFMLPIKHPWVSQFVRYVLTPRSWFAQYMQHTVSKRLMLRGQRVRRIPKPFASVHVRFGEKQLETALQPLDKYMRMLQKKGGNIKDVFLSTETDSVIEYLTKNYTNYNFYYLNYTRHEFIHTTSKKLESTEYPTEYMMSMANLYVAVEADMFVGSLTSGWCMVIHALERTRGDGGYDYFSVDRGSAYSTCF